MSAILACMSVLFTWIIADYYANYQAERENKKLIDGVGERSSEKILNQSKQLWAVEEWATTHAEGATDDNAETLLAIREMLKIIRSSNNTYLGDWEGVVSDAVRKKMQERIEAQDKIFKGLERPSDSASTPPPHSSPNEGSLPSYLTPEAARDLTNLTTLLEQTPRTNNEKKSQGSIRVRLNRDSYRFNFTGKLYPRLVKVPEDLRARIITSPPNAPSRVSVHAATGTTFDFHIHARSYEPNVNFPRGEYVFEYIIQTENPHANDFLETASEPPSSSVENSREPPQQTPISKQTNPPAQLQ